jgi:hypothetical protein
MTVSMRKLFARIVIDRAEAQRRQMEEVQAEHNAKMANAKRR